MSYECWVFLPILEDGLQLWAVHTHLEFYLLARAHDPWLSIADDLIGVVAIVPIHPLMTGFVDVVRHAQNKVWNRIWAEE